jgi:Ca-activated chloride channel family protein
MTAAQRATKAAIDALRDGALFAVIEGTNVARVVYPTGPRLVAATPETRRAAKKAVSLLRAGGARGWVSGWNWPAACSPTTRRPCGT